MMVDVEVSGTILGYATSRGSDGAQVGKGPGVDPALHTQRTWHPLTPA